MSTGIIREIHAALGNLADSEHARVAQRFFKTAPGEYGTGDKFLGVRVPELRKLARQYKHATIDDAFTLLASKWHEERLLALVMLVSLFERGDDGTRETVYRRYLQSTAQVNNWDLVDASAHRIVGPFLEARAKKPLHDLARSRSLWERRIAIIATYPYIRAGRFAETLKISRTLLGDEEDLIHKAVGWMLREVGNRDRTVEESFLAAHYKKMPRTMLRYAIEKFPEAKRQRYLKGTI